MANHPLKWPLSEAVSAGFKWHVQLIWVIHYGTNQKKATAQHWDKDLSDFPSDGNHWSIFRSIHQLV
jgi:hypothetical protein